MLLTMVVVTPQMVSTIQEMIMLELVAMEQRLQHTPPLPIQLEVIEI